MIYKIEITFCLYISFVFDVWVCVQTCTLYMYVCIWHVVILWNSLIWSYMILWYGMLFNYDVDVILMICSWMFFSNLVYMCVCGGGVIYIIRCVILSNLSFAWIIYIIHHIVGLCFVLWVCFAMCFVLSHILLPCEIVV